MFVASTNGTRARVGAPCPERTPDEVFTGREHTPKAVPRRAVLEVKHIDGNRDLPVLRLRPAA